MKTTIVIMMLVCLLCAMGCAAGSATAGYAMRSGTADSLKPEAEDRIMRRMQDWHAKP